MTILYFCPRWGSEHIPFDEFCARAADAGYNGVEISFPLNEEALRDSQLDAIAKYNLKFVAQHWETIDPDPARYIDEFEERLEWLAATAPIIINSQTGRDWFDFPSTRKLIDTAHRVSARTGIPIKHETHRGRFAFCAAATAQHIEADPALRLTADFSHWCTVSESLLENQQHFVDSAISRTDHIHARVGHEEGPQVSDPRAPEWKYAVDAHLAWWDKIVEIKKAAEESLTITPEFGPATYMPTLPYTRQPVASQWDINLHMMNLLKTRYL